MYSRVLRSLFVVSGNCLTKSECFTQTLSGAVKFPHGPQYFKNSLINFRSCTTLKPQNKDKRGEEKLDELIKNPEIEKQYKVLQLEIDVMRQSGENLPSIIKPRHWVELLELNSRPKRRRYLSFLFGLEKKKENVVAKKQKKSLERNTKFEDSDLPEHLQYKLGGNSLMLRVYDTTVNNFYNWRLMRATIFGEKFIIDCGFEDKMTKFESKNCARQLQLAFAANRQHDNPFDLIFCNLNPKGYLFEELYSFIPTMLQPEFPFQYTEKSYLDFFDKSKLVYLTPDCNTDMDATDHDAIYIIGGIVDKSNNLPLSMAKAKREGLRMARLPINRYVEFGSGSGKCLTLNQMVDIIADVRTTGDWVHSLRHIPRRKLLASREYQMTKKMERLLKYNDVDSNAYRTSSAPKDFSMKSRNKFRNNM